MVHGKNRIPYRIDRRLSGLAGPDYDATISFGLPLEPEDSQYGKSRLKKGAAILVRSDQRRSTAEMCVTAMKEVWPDRQLLARPTTARHAGISNGHGRGGQKAKEIDLLMPGSRASTWWHREAFVPHGDVAQGESWIPPIAA